MAIKKGNIRLGGIIERGRPCYIIYEYGIIRARAHAHTHLYMYMAVAENDGEPKSDFNYGPSAVLLLKRYLQKKIPATESVAKTRRTRTLRRETSYYIMVGA